MHEEEKLNHGTYWYDIEKNLQMLQLETEFKFSDRDNT